MRSKYFDPIEHFPDKIDQLLEALNRVRFRFFSYDDVNFFVSIYVDQQTRKSEKKLDNSSIIRHQ
jgi:hypothetical protein